MTLDPDFSGAQLLADASLGEFTLASTLGVHFDGTNGTGSSISVSGGGCTGGHWNTGGSWANRISSSWNGCYKLRHHNPPTEHSEFGRKTDGTKPETGNRTTQDRRRGVRARGVRYSTVCLRDLHRGDGCDPDDRDCGYDRCGVPTTEAPPSWFHELTVRLISDGAVQSERMVIDGAFLLPSREEPVVLDKPPYSPLGGSYLPTVVPDPGSGSVFTARSRNSRILTRPRKVRPGVDQQSGCTTWRLERSEK